MAIKKHDLYFDCIDWQYYDFFKELRIRKICPKQIKKDYGNRMSFMLNHHCPIVVARGGVALDELADGYGFESTCDFLEHIKNYKPLYKVIKEMEDYYDNQDLC